MITSIFFDVDGTLVSFKTHEVPESTFAALRKLKEEGVRLFIATGRGKDGLAVLKNFPFDGYITLNGQYCYTGNDQYHYTGYKQYCDNGNGRVIFENYMAQASVTKLLEVLEKHPFPCGFTTQDGKIFNFRDQRVDAIHAITHNDNQPAGDISHMAEKKVYQCMAFISAAEEKELMKQLPDCISARWHPSFADISPKGGTKSLGIDKMLENYGLKRKDSMAFGDGGNDIAMLKTVGYSVAMGNAAEEVKACADFVTDCVDDDGILHAIQKLYDIYLKRQWEDGKNDSNSYGDL